MELNEATGAVSDLDSIRDKPMMELTAEEIAQLTRQEQSWIWGYRASVKAASTNGR